MSRGRRTRGRGRKKKKNKVPLKGPTDRPKAGGGSSSEVPVLTRAVIFGDNFSPDHPAVVSQFYTEEIRDKFIKGEFSLDQCLRDAQVTYLQQISLLQFLQKDVVPAAQRAKENYDKALKASTSATEECAKEIHDAEVAELKRKLEAAIEGERKSVSDTLRYVEKAFDVAIEQVKVRNPAYNLDLHGLSYEYEVIDGAVVWVDGDKKIEVPPEGLPAATGAQTDV
ncbi:hypothetical protein SESBI_15510 [Sesbania bispinosa]|nr:hypothetical protein SESBI_15510 [Sesbania bispinosa]